MKISIEEYLQKKLEEELFEGSLTDYESSDSESHISMGDHSQDSLTIPWAQDALSAQKPRRAETIKDYNKTKRRHKRAAQQAKTGTDTKAVAKRRRLESAAVSLELSFCIDSKEIKVTKPGWLGKRIVDVPRKAYTKAELMGPEHKMCGIPWDGR